MKTVFKSSELPHIWAHQRAPHGRCSSAMSFDGPRFYSYRATIAHLHTTPTGGTVVFYNCMRYSNTTAKHQSWVRSAIQGMRTFTAHTSDITSPEQMARACITVAEEALENANAVRNQYPRRKAPVALLERKAVNHLTVAREVVALFNLTGFEDTPWDNFTALLERVEARKAQYEKYAREAAERREREAQEELQEWLRGERERCPYAITKTYFRLTPSGDLESSKGVTIPRSEARSAIAFILSKRDTGWKRNGETFPIAGYHLDLVSEAGVVAGCHRFDWMEFDRVRELLANA